MEETTDGKLPERAVEWPKTVAEESGSELVAEAPTELVSESVAEDEDAPIETAANEAIAAESVGDLARIVEGLSDLGYSVSASPGGTRVLLELPAGRSIREVNLEPSAAAELLESGQRGWRSLKKYDGVWNSDLGEVEVVVQGERFGGSVSRVIDRHSGREGSPEDPTYIGLTDPFSPLEIRLGRASGISSMFFNRMMRGLSPITVRVVSVHVSTAERADQLVESLVDALSLQMSMLHNVSFTAARLQGRARGGIGLRRTQKPLTFPVSTYPHAPVALYQAGRDRMTSPLLRYWAFYQVLEYFFPRYLQRETVSNIARIVRSPAFDPHDESTVLRLAALSGAGRGSQPSEEQQLVLCLKSVTSMEDVGACIEESGLTSALADRKSALSESVVRLDADDLLLQLGKRIYDIRCKIVHSKSLGGQNGGAGLLPGTEDEDLIFQELRLMRFLAEQALAANASRLDTRAWGAV